MRRPLLLLLLALALLIGAALIHERPPQERLVSAAAELQVRVDQAYAGLSAMATAALDADTIPMDGEHGQGETGLRLFKDHVVTAWTDHAPISDATLDTARATQLTLPDGIYLHAHATDRDRSAHALQRVWFRPPFENQYLNKHFDPGFTLAKGVMATEESGLGPVVRDADGQVMLRLEWADENPSPGVRSLAVLILLLLATALSIAALWTLALRIPSAPLALAGFLAVLLGVRLATLAYGSFEALATYAVFDPSLFASSFFMPSLGDLLINTGILLCAALFTRQVLLRQSVLRHAQAAAAGAMVLLFFCAGGIGSVMIALVHDSSVSLDLFRVQGFNGYSVAALTAIGVLLFAWCVLADALVR